MTRQKSFKRLVRTRMDKTGESYTAARASLLAGKDGGDHAGAAPVMPTSEETIRNRTGQGWEQWFDLLDESGVGERTHKEIAARLREERGVDGWSSQSITVGYERARKGRAVGERDTGFEISASKTVAVPVERLFDAVVDEALRERWLSDAELRERTSTRPRSARYDWADGSTRVIFGFEAKDAGKSLVSLIHERLADADQAERMKAYWRERLAALKSELEGGEGDA
jgi:uncharacterized protein YndB with AHSA1/START domain